MIMHESSYYKYNSRSRTVISRCGPSWLPVLSLHVFPFLCLWPVSVLHATVRIMYSIWYTYIYALFFNLYIHALDDLILCITPWCAEGRAQIFYLSSLTRTKYQVAWLRPLRPVWPQFHREFMLLSEGCWQKPIFAAAAALFMTPFKLAAVWAFGIFAQEKPFLIHPMTCPPFLNCIQLYCS